MCAYLDDDFMVTTTTKYFISHYRLLTWFHDIYDYRRNRASSRMGGSGGAEMVTLTPNGDGKQRTIVCQDDSGLWGGITDVG